MIIVEPHADDAFLSMGGIIEREIRAGVVLEILTVYSGTRDRAQDAYAYAQAVGADWTGLGFEEKGNARVNGPAECSLDMYPLDPLATYYLPLGFAHPEHAFVRDLFSKALNRAYYLDQPYGSKLKNQPLVLDALRGRTILDIYKPGARKWRHIPLFRDQSKFFFYNNVEALSKTFELVVS